MLRKVVVLRKVVALLLLGAGVWCLGAAAWIHVKAQVAQHLLQRAWARAVAGDAQAKPWLWADTWPVARLRVRAHGVDLIVLAGVSGQTLAFGPGHAESTAVPGVAGTAVVTGHRDTLFRFLQRMRVGDEVIVDVPGRPAVRFLVQEMTVVDSRTATIRDANGAASLVLVTCYPFDAVRPGGPLRYAVVARLYLNGRVEGGDAPAVSSRTIRSIDPWVFYAGSKRCCSTTAPGEVSMTSSSIRPS